MACDIAGGTRIKFLRSGVEIIPISVDYTSEKRKYKHARVKTTRTAGVHVHENANIPEPVEIWTNDILLARLYLPEDAITLSENKSDIHLMDPRHVLEAGEVDFNDEQIRFGELIDKFRGWYNNSDADPNNVITEIRATEDADLNRITESWEAQLSPQEDYTDEDVFEQLHSDYTNAVVEHYSDKLRNYIVGAAHTQLGLLEENGGVDFDQFSLKECLAGIVETFEVSSWVDDDGVLWIGPSTVNGGRHVAGTPRGSWNLREFNVTEHLEQVTQSYVRGDYFLRNNPGMTQTESQSQQVRAWGYATLGGRPDYMLSLMAFEDREGEAIKDEMKSTDGDALARQAKRNLIERIYDNNSGTLVINPLASGTEFSEPHDVYVGDFVGVIPPEGSDCMGGSTHPTGFNINHVQHKINPNEGWTLEVGVGAIPDVDVYSTSLRTDLASTPFQDGEEFYNDLQADTTAKAPDDIVGQMDENKSIADHTVEFVETVLSGYDP